MGKSEVEPLSPVSDSSSGSDSEPEHAPEAMEELAVCDEPCAAGEDEPRSEGAPGCEGQIGGESTVHWHRGRGGRRGRWMNPRMPRGPPPHIIMHFMRHGPPSRVGPAGPCGPAFGSAGPCGPAFGPGGPWGPAFGPGGPWGPTHGPRGFHCGPPRRGPFKKKRFLKHMMSNPEFWQRIREQFAEDGPKNEETLTEKISKIDGTNKNGPWGPTHGPRGFHCGLPRHGPFKKKRFLKHMMSNPEFWQRICQQFAEDGPQNEETLTEEFSKMDVTNENGKESKNAAETMKRKCKKFGKKCHGKRQERWQRFLGHMFGEMNLHAPAGSEGDEGNLTDECTKEAEQTEAAQDKRKVHFGGDNENAMTSEGIPHLFPWGRRGMFRRFGRWARPETFRGDPRMMMQGISSQYERESSPEGAGTAARSPGRCGRMQRKKMFRQMAAQMGWTSDSEVTSDGEALTDGEGEKNEVKERRKAERQKMRRVMRETGWMPWMMGRGHHHRHHCRHHTPEGGAPHSIEGHYHRHPHVRGIHSHGKDHH